jgi:hypothetical protein
MPKTPTRMCVPSALPTENWSVLDYEDSDPEARFEKWISRRLQNIRGVRTEAHPMGMLGSERRREAVHKDKAQEKKPSQIGTNATSKSVCTLPDDTTGNVDVGATRMKCHPALKTDVGGEAETTLVAELRRVLVDVSTKAAELHAMKHNIQQCSDMLTSRVNALSSSGKGVECSGPRSASPDWRPSEGAW